MSEPTTPLAGRWIRRPTTRGTAAALIGGAVLIAGVLWRYPGLVVLGGALLLLVGAALLFVLRGTPVRVYRDVWPQEVTRFDLCEARLRVVRTGGLLPLPVDAVEHVDQEPLPVTLPPLVTGRIAEASYPVPTQRRGVHTVGPLHVHRRVLAGLAANWAALGSPLQVRVLPRVFPVDGMPGGVRRAHVAAEERVPYGGTDLIGLRDYLPGDDLRRLHWATSARAGKLMVREDADPSSTHLTLLLDDRAGSYPDLADLEEAVEVAASLAVAAAAGEHGVRLLTISGQREHTVLAAPGVPADAKDLVALLAEIGPHGTRSEPAPLPVTDLDVVAVVTGSTADLGPLVTQAARAAVGVVAVVDRSISPDRGTIITASGVTVLRGASSRDLLSRWDYAVVRSHAYR